MFFPPLFLLATHWICIWFTAKDPKNQNRNHKPFGMVLWIIPVISNFSSGMMYALALGTEFSMETVMQIALGLMFAIIGNYLPKCRMNYTIGIKVPWAYSSEENWNATHRFAGRTWVIGGLLVIFAVLLPGDWGMALMVVILMALAIIPMVYSYRFYRKEKAAGKAVVIPPMVSNSKVFKGAMLFTAVLLLGVAILLFTGEVEVTCGNTSFTVDSTFYSPLTVDYDAITSIEYRSGNVSGSRVGGFGSLRLLLGFFQNEEFGTYTRYTYYRPEACIVLQTETKILVISGEDAQETQAIYTELISRTGK